MTRPIVREHNIATNEIVDREMNDAEFELYLENQTKLANTLTHLGAKAAEKSALLTKLGITEDEAKLLLS